ncbi:MAG: pirin family protein [Sandaracinaceae bacterium]|jgi:redox-sensitive bicupin YhaK (pirin superfamily)|nr:pirin family protein [Sandaracinaceae bacterium]MBK6807434.1 pirin family protein [Sandaracinaceae bacterium]MBK7152239.1 pirin family protein [Sandaracinaceae bacterium]MBK8592842.1 pirin family protein [Sandaracinaceae bacterium]
MTTTTIRKARERGMANHGWLKSAHTFSFADYYDPQHMGFGVLRVLNDDRVDAGEGFPRHPHRDMEIVSYVVEGALGHKDTLGTGSVIRPGEIQRMTAGRGIAHSEMNASQEEDVRFLQIWFLPAERNTAPGYQQQDFPYDPARPIDLMVTPTGEGGTVSIGQDVRIFRVRFDAAGHAEHTLPAGRAAWVQIVRGTLRVDGEALSEGDGLAIHDEEAVRSFRVEGDAGAEALFLELPKVSHA